MDKCDYENIIKSIKEEIKKELDKDTYGFDICTEQGVRTGYLSALCIIEKYEQVD